MNNKWLLGGLILVIVLGGAGYYFSKPKAPEGDPIKIGAIMILSGEGASWGEASRNGMMLAIEELNRKGGILGRSVQGIYEDDRSDPKDAVSAFNKLTSIDDVKFIVGPNWSNTGVAVRDLATQSKTVIISPSLGVKEFNEGSEYAFNTWPHDFILSAQLANYVYGKGYRHIALFGANDVWVKDQSNAFSTRFKELGGTIELLYEPLVNVTDVRTEVAKVRSNKTIDAIVMTTNGYSLTVLNARQIRESGVALPIFNITTDSKIVADCAENCEGMIFPTFLTPSKEFAERYAAQYEREVEIGADSAYDAVMMLAEAMEATKSTDPDIVKEYLSNIEEYDGVSGHLVSDGKRAFTKAYLLKEVQNGVAVAISN